MAEAMICEKISQTMAVLPTAAADAPAFDHGETDDKPTPVPNASKISEVAAATAAPPITAAQDTPDEDASFLTIGSTEPDEWEPTSGAIAGCAIGTFLREGPRGT